MKARKMCAERVGTLGIVQIMPVLPVTLPQVTAYGVLPLSRVEPMTRNSAPLVVQTRNVFHDQGVGVARDPLKGLAPLIDEHDMRWVDFNRSEIGRVHWTDL
jgi:hypothetical protein